MKKTRIIAALLCLIMIFAVACTPNEAATPAPSPTPVATPSVTPTPTPDSRTEVNLAMLVGPTGVGAAKLLYDNERGTTMNQYNVTMAAANDEITTKLASGELDIAAVATNVASALYQKTDKAIQIIGVNTLGVLYILERGSVSIYSMADLEGKTIYTTGQGANPEYVLNYLLEQNGLTPGEDVFVEFKAAEEVSALMLSGQADVCMLPVPAATAVLLKSAGESEKNQIHSVIDLTEQWDTLDSDSQLTMGCVVVRTEFAQENPEAVAAFLEEYTASVNYMSDSAMMDVEGETNPAQLVADYGITPSTAIAKAAIPQCNLVSITGADNIRNAVQGYYEVLFSANPGSIGGSIPDDAFYFQP